MFVLYFWLIMRAFHLKQPKADITNSVVNIKGTHIKMLFFTFVEALAKEIQIQHCAFPHCMAESIEF